MYLHNKLVGSIEKSPQCGSNNAINTIPQSSPCWRFNHQTSSSITMESPMFSGWWLGHHSENMISSIGMMTFPSHMGKLKNGNQTTNQFLFSPSSQLTTSHCARFKNFRSGWWQITCREAPRRPPLLQPLKSRMVRRLSGG